MEVHARDGPRVFQNPAGSESLGEWRCNMHPGYMGWWRRRRASEGGEESEQPASSEGCGHGGWRGGGGWGGHGRWAGHWGGGGGGWGGGGDGEGGESFGVRRPLR